MLKSVVVIIVFFSNCCSFSAQSTKTGIANDDSIWQTVESRAAGFKVVFPCDPLIKIELFQEVPKIAHLYSYKCEYDGISFSVSLPERFGDFDPGQAEDNLDGVEQMLRSMIGEKAEMISQSQPFQNYSSRLIEVDGGGTLGHQLHIEHPRGMYGIQAFGKYKNNAERSSTEAAARRFIDSFALLENY